MSRDLKENNIKLLLLLFASMNLFANIYPSFSSKELITIEKTYGVVAKNRIVDYAENMQKIKTLPPKKQLLQVNFYLNQLLPQYDEVIQKKEDYWATPKEFLRTGFGDCEDYVIIKYFSLIKLGFAKNQLYLTVVKEKFNGGNHMVLSYFPTPNSEPIILDNLSFKILNLHKRKDLEVDIFINNNGIYKLYKNKLHKIANSSAQYEELMKKVKANN